MIWVKLGSLFMFFAVTLGAFGAHAMKTKLTPYALDVYKTAVLYHLIHAMGLFIVGWLSTISVDPKIGLAGGFFTIGVVLFSGSLYLLSITGCQWLGAIPPLGGLSFLLGWLFIFFVQMGQ